MCQYMFVFPIAPVISTAIPKEVKMGNQPFVVKTI